MTDNLPVDLGNHEYPVSPFDLLENSVFEALDVIYPLICNVNPFLCH
jgi:hypothetical protein